MTIDNEGRQRVLMNEKALYRYSSALARGDFDTLEAVLHAAEQDPALEQMILELHAEYTLEEDTLQAGTDVELVRGLLREHIPSAFAEEESIVQPLTVGNVVARLEVDRKVAEGDQQVARHLRDSQRVLPEIVNARAIGALARELGVAASDRFWRAFRDTAVMLGLGRSQNEMRLAAAREQRAQRTQAGRKPSQPDTDQEVSE